MGLIERSSFEPHPAGSTIGVLVDFKLTETDGPYGKRTQIQWSFDTEEEMDNGKPFRISYWTTPVINPKSNLHKLLVGLGENPEDPKFDEIEDVKDFDFLLNRKCELFVVHKKKPDGSVKASIESIAPLKRKRRAQPEDEPQLVGAGASSSGRQASIWSDED